MAFKDRDTKILWGRAAGMCSRPDCRRKLTLEGEGGVDFLIGEMAHQIAQSPKGPRGGKTPGVDTYGNLILLCPTHHTEIDKAPEGTFPIETLAEWKRSHEEWVDSWADNPTYKTAREMANEIQRLLDENQMHFEEYGPTSEVAIRNPASTAQTIWMARKLDTLLPNNSRIVQILDSNISFLEGDLLKQSVKFKMHAAGFEGNQYERVEDYPQFPEEFQKAIKELADE